MSSTLTIPSLLSSHEFYLAAGTVTVDTNTSKLLIIHDRANGEYKLPRGRKDWNETLEAAAVRETFEEAGVHCRLLPVPSRTRATAPKEHPLISRAVFDETGDVTSRVPLTEPIAMMQHIRGNGALAVVFFFVASADSTVAFTKDTRNLDEDYEAIWIPFQDVGTYLKGQTYAEIARKGINLAKFDKTEEVQVGIQDDKQTIITSHYLHQNGVESLE